MRLLPLAAAAVIAAPLLASCSSGMVVDHDKLTGEITTKLNSEYAQLGRSVSSVECDDPGENPPVGTEFQCIADVDGAKVHIKVTTTSENIDVTYETVEKLFDFSHAEEVLADSVSAQVGEPVTVECGDGVQALAQGSTFTCVVTNDAGDTGELLYTVGENGAEDRWEMK